MEVGLLFYNLLLRMKKEGYWIENFFESVKELEKMIQVQGVVFGMYVEGVFDEFMKIGNFELVIKE